LAGRDGSVLLPYGKQVVILSLSAVAVWSRREVAIANTEFASTALNFVLMSPEVNKIAACS
jgi:hypothetical protein